MRVDTVEDGDKVIQRVVIPHHDQDISGPNAKSFRREIVTSFAIELIEFGMLRRPLFRCPLGYGKNREEHNRKCNSGSRRDLLGEEIDNAQGDEGQCYQPQPERDFYASDLEIEGDSELTLATMVVP